MSVKINSHAVDQVTLDFITQGSNEASLMAQETPLDNSIDYIFAVEELTVPTAGIPIFAPGTNELLLNIKKRQTGVAPALFAATEYNNTFSVSDARKIYDVATFTSEVAKWANKFSLRRIAGGMLTANYDGNTIAAGADIDLLDINLDGSGRLQFVGSSYFWDRFVIEPSAYGIKLLHLENIVSNGVISVTQILQVRSTETLVANGVAVAGGNTSTVTLASSLPIYTSLDHRAELQLTTDLNIPNQIEIRDGIQIVDRNIVRVPFVNEAKTTLKIKDQRFSGEMSIQTKTYSGRYPFIKKTDRSKNWVSLNASFELRYFRFQLLCSYRYFDAGVFKLKRVPVPISADDFWELGIRFVSIV